MLALLINQNFVMKHYFIALLLCVPFLAISQTTTHSYGGSGTSHYDKGIPEVYNKNAKYIVLKLWNDSEPLSEKEKTNFSNVQKQLSGKGVTVIDFQWKTKQDLENLFKQYDIAAEVSTETGLHIKTGDMQMLSTSTKALLIIENKKARSVCAGENCEENFLKPYFQISRSREIK